MVTSLAIIELNKWTRPLTFLTIHRVIRSEQMILFVPGRCQKILHPIGWIGKEVLTYAMQLYPMGRRRRCKNGRTDYCCRRLLFCQPDFMTQKSRFEEFVRLRGHIYNFYPKYHCELNFIGALQNFVTVTPRAWRTLNSYYTVWGLIKYNLKELSVGLSGAEAAWANKKYHGHRKLPPIMLAPLQ